MGAFKIVDQVYDAMSDGHKIMSIYMDMVNPYGPLEQLKPNMELRRRELYQPIFRELYEEMHAELRKKCLNLNLNYTISPFIDIIRKIAYSPYFS